MSAVMCAPIVGTRTPRGSFSPWHPPPSRHAPCEPIRRVRTQPVVSRGSCRLECRIAEAGPGDRPGPCGAASVASSVETPRAVRADTPRAYVACRLARSVSSRVQDRGRGARRPSHLSRCGVRGIRGILRRAATSRARRYAACVRSLSSRAFRVVSRPAGAPHPGADPRQPPRRDSTGPRAKYSRKPAATIHRRGLMPFARPESDRTTTHEMKPAPMPLAIE